MEKILNFKDVIENIYEEISKKDPACASNSASKKKSDIKLYMTFIDFLKNEENNNSNNYLNDDQTNKLTENRLNYVNSYGYWDNDFKEKYNKVLNYLLLCSLINISKSESKNTEDASKKCGYLFHLIFQKTFFSKEANSSKECFECLFESLKLFKETNKELIKGMIKLDKNQFYKHIFYKILKVESIEQQKLEKALEFFGDWLEEIGEENFIGVNTLDEYEYFLKKLYKEKHDFLINKMKDEFPCFEEKIDYNKLYLEFLRNVDYWSIKKLYDNGYFKNKIEVNSFGEFGLKASFILTMGVRKENSYKNYMFEYEKIIELLYSLGLDFGVDVRNDKNKIRDSCVLLNNGKKKNPPSWAPKITETLEKYAKRREHKYEIKNFAMVFEKIILNLKINKNFNDKKQNTNLSSVKKFI